MNIETSFSILATLVIAFISYYLFEGRKIAELKRQNAELQTKIAELQQFIAQLQAVNSELQARNIILTEEIAGHVKSQQGAKQHIEEQKNINSHHKPSRTVTGKGWINNW